MTKILIGLHGEKYAGKDSAALGLLRERGFVKVSFAHPMKEMLRVYLCSTVSVGATVDLMLDKLLEVQGVSAYSRRQLVLGDGQGVATTYLDGRTPAYAIAELISWGIQHIGGEFWYGNGTGPAYADDQVELLLEGYLKQVESPRINNKTPRYLMQTIGTEWGRERMHQDFWRDLGLRMAKAHPRCVITDVRFDNEAQAVRDAGGYMVKIIREGMPKANDAHASEAGVSDHLINSRVYNQSTVEVLQKRLISLVDTNVLMTPQII